MNEAMVDEELGGAQAGRLVAEMAGAIRGARQVLITSHVNPDGDALGSEVGLLLGLAQIGKRARVVNDHPAPEKYRFLDPRGAVEVLDHEPGPGSFPDVDLGILLDTSEPPRTGRLEKSFFRPGLRRICLDHHPGPPRALFEHHWIAPASPAAANLVLRLLDALGVTLDRSIAAALFVALATDTGWFRFANTTPLALRDAARLVAAGLDLEGLHRTIYGEFRPARVMLLGKLLSGIRLELGGKFAWSLLDRETLRGSGVALEELDGLSEELKTIGGAELVALITETERGSFKVSLRSRGALPVNGIAADFAGGGHARAAGFRISGDREAVMARIVERVRKELTVDS
jgi:bifunctional oligoribonuclease and PAP phosphatase NrnA